MQVCHDVVFRFNPLVVAIREAGKRQAVYQSGSSHATGRADAGGEGDMGSQANETLGELKGWVDVALHWKCHEEEVALLRHDCVTKEEVKL